LHSLDPDLAITSVVPMSAVVATSVQRPRFVMFLLATFGVIALVLAAVGLYGVISQSARQRTHEIGIRVALGAGRRTVIGQIVREGMQLAGIGIIIGIGLSFAVTRLLSTQLYGVTATDPATFAVIALLLATVAFIASYLPANRASRVDPVTAMRGE
jgi:putative ABC transport system permease protein